MASSLYFEDTDTSFEEYLALATFGGDLDVDDINDIDVRPLSPPSSEEGMQEEPVTMNMYVDDSSGELFQDFNAGLERGHTSSFHENSNTINAPILDVVQGNQATNGDLHLYPSTPSIDNGMDSSEIDDEDGTSSLAFQTPSYSAATNSSEVPAPKQNRRKQQHSCRRDASPPMEPRGLPNYQRIHYQHGSSQNGLTVDDVPMDPHEPPKYALDPYEPGISKAERASRIKARACKNYRKHTKETCETTKADLLEERRKRIQAESVVIRLQKENRDLQRKFLHLLRQRPQ